MYIYTPTKEQCESLLSAYLDNQNLQLRNLEEVLNRKQYTRFERAKYEHIKDIWYVYSLVSEIDMLCKKLKQYNAKISKYDTVKNNNNSVINKLYNNYKQIYTQLFTYDFDYLWYRYSSPLMEEFIPDFWGDYSGEFFDYTMGQRDSIEWTLQGIELLGHEEDYPWLLDFKEELKKVDNYKLKNMVPSAMKYYYSIEEVFPKPEFYTFYPKSFWWRQLELDTFLEISKK